MLYRMFNHLCQQYKVYVYLRHGLWVTLHKMFQYLCISLHVLWLTSKESIPSPESSSSSAGLGACFGVISWYTSLGLRLRSSRSNGSCANRKGDISFITDWNTNRIKLKLLFGFKMECFRGGCGSHRYQFGSINVLSTGALNRQSHAGKRRSSYNRV